MIDSCSYSPWGSWRVDRLYGIVLGLDWRALRSYSVFFLNIYLIVNNIKYFIITLINIKYFNSLIIFLFIYRTLATGPPEALPGCFVPEVLFSTQGPYQMITQMTNFRMLCFCLPLLWARASQVSLHSNDSEINKWDFHNGPVAETPDTQCRSHPGLIPWSRN